MSVDLLRFVVVGSVDDGKSTLIGRLLFEAQSLADDHLSQVKKASKQNGAEIDFSLFTDGLRAEREQGITIDVAYRHFATARRRFIVADTPGHVQYTRNMATGASTADLGVILIDARLGVLPQTRRHAYLASLLGIPHLAVVVNKMDLAGFEAARFEQIRAELLAFTARLSFRQVTFFPVSATQGDNVVKKSARTPWFSGAPLLEWLETVEVQRPQLEAPLRFPVQLVLRPDLDYRGFAGQLASGSVKKGEDVVLLPSGRKTRVAGIDTFEGEVAQAFAPSSVTLRLEDHADVSRGELIATVTKPAKFTRRFDADLVWLDEAALDSSREYLLKHTTRLAPARVVKVQTRTELENLERVAAARLELNEIGRVTVECPRGLLADPYVENRATGAFILIDALSNATCAAGMIVSVEPATDEVKPVSPEERAARFGHAGAVLVLAESVDAVAVERALFDHQVHAVVVRSEEAALACAAAGLVALTRARVPSGTFVESVEDALERLGVRR